MGEDRLKNFKRNLLNRSLGYKREEIDRKYGKTVQ
jgi:hypothetical protein